MAAKAKATASTKVVREAPGPALVKVTAAGNFQIGYHGQVAGPGESLDVPPELAEQWVASGIARAG